MEDAKLPTCLFQEYGSTWCNGLLPLATKLEEKEELSRQDTIRQSEALFLYGMKTKKDVNLTTAQTTELSGAVTSTTSEGESQEGADETDSASEGRVPEGEQSEATPGAEQSRSISQG